MPSDGPWRVEQFHRAPGPVRDARAESGRLTFTSPPALVGELQLFRLTRANP